MPIACVRQRTATVTLAGKLPEAGKVMRFTAEGHGCGRWKRRQGDDRGAVGDENAIDCAVFPCSNEVATAYRERARPR